MEKIFNLTSTFKALNEDEDGSVHICGMASTADQDRANDVIMAEAWTKGGLNNFEKNPIILFNHNYDKPIGRATGLKVTDKGLELKAKISKSAPDHVAQLVKEGILGAFSVGFRVKDADYIQETDGLKIKDAELFEVSVVSVPCNQAATFSLSKSFDSMEEYEEFKKTFKLTNREDLAGQSLAKEDVKASSVASDSPYGADTAQQEIKMSEVKTPEIDLEAFAKKVAEETAAKIAMKQAEEKAAAEKAAKEAEEKAAAEAEAKAAKEEEVTSAIRTGIESGTEQLLGDFEKRLNEKDAKLSEVLKEFGAQLAEKNEEITKIRESKRVFADRGEKGVIAGNKEFMYAHMLGVMTNKGWDTDYARQVFEKASVSYPAGTTDNLANLATEVSTMIEKEIQLELRTAALFREIPVSSKTTVMPLQSDVETAVWSSGGESALGSGDTTGLANRGGSAGTFAARQTVLNVERLISTSYMDNYVDEEVLVNLMPMLVEGVARAHARAVDKAIIQGNGGLGVKGFLADGLGNTGYALDSGITFGTQLTDGADKLTAADLVKARAAMGVYGMNPQDIVYIVSQSRYYDLLEDVEFTNINEVGSDMALKITGLVGAVYGSPVVVSDNFPAEVEDGQAGAIAVNTRNYAIPRLRGVNVEQDYEVAAQRRVIVATQHLGFHEMFTGQSGKTAAVYVKKNNVA
jgi:HK97 family phage prohead protease/HK97 family phage major capsid protein